MVHGAWHNPSLYEPLPSLLTRAGYALISPTLPSVGGSMETFDEDVVVIRKELQQLVDAGKEIAVLMHSYGGMVGSEAVRGFSKDDVEGPGGVIRMIYMCSFALPEGTSLMDALNNIPPPWTVKVNEHQEKPINCHHTFYNDVSKEIAERMEAGLKYHASRTFQSKISYAAWKYIDSTYIICELDNALPGVAQEAMSGQDGRWLKVERLQASHSPWLSMPEETAELVRRGAGETF